VKKKNGVEELIVSKCLLNKILGIQYLHSRMMISLLIGEAMIDFI
jgi:hypothetical protein